MNPIQISVYNQAKTPLGFDLEKFVAALQAYDAILVEAWGLPPCKLTATAGPVPGSWGIVFLDSADVQGALAYHTDEGLPLSKVFVATTLQAGESVSVSASHEHAEMRVDPGCNSYSMAPNGTLYCTEVADAVEETSFNVQGFAMSNFCLPPYFGQPGPAGKFDYCGDLRAPFTLQKGGYCTTTQAGQVNQTFGSDGKAARFAAEDRRGRRGARRLAQLAVTFSVGATQTQKGPEPTGSIEVTATF